MFPALSNATCNNTLFSLGTIPGMADEVHETATRLYAAAKRIAATEGKSAIARLLNESPQAVNNWERRGVSEGGALKAQAVIGCDANWILTGHGAMAPGWPFQHIPMERFLALDQANRAYVEGKLSAAIEEVENGNQDDLQRFNAARTGHAKKVTRRRAA